MRKYLSLVLLTIIFLPLTIRAKTVTINNPLGSEDMQLWELLEKIIDFIFFISIPIAAIMIIIAGFRFVTAMGEPEKIQTAKKMILWVTVGLFIIFLAKALIVLFGKIFGIDIAPAP